MPLLVSMVFKHLWGENGATVMPLLLCPGRGVYDENK